MRTVLVASLLASAAALVLGQGCGGTSGGTGSGSNSSSGSGSGAGSGAGGSSGSLIGGSGGGDGGSTVCNPNPGNYDIPGNGCDDDGDGLVDNVTVCDQSLLAGGSAHDMANALGLCQDVAGPKWGIVAATFQHGYAGGAPNDAQHGILPGFGSVILPREGSALGALSTGFARAWDDAAGTGSGSCPVPTAPPSGGGAYGSPCFKGYQPRMNPGGTAPPGYPKAAAACPAETGAGVQDVISLELQVKVPLNAQGLQFDFDFHSSEWPEYVCTQFNDGFVAWLQSAAFPGASGDLNISYDAKNNPVSVNNAFFDRCTTGASTGCCARSGTGPEGCSAPARTSACAGGPSELGGTGFQDDGTFCGGPSTGGGATGWLTTTAPVKAGEVITLQFIIWDTGDWNWDSSVLLDKFRWQPGPTTTGTTRPSQ